MINMRKKFTLIELIVVIAILGILSAIVVPNISSFQKEAKDVRALADLRNVQTAYDMYMLDEREVGEADVPVLMTTGLPEDPKAVVVVGAKYKVIESSTKKTVAAENHIINSGAYLEKLASEVVYSVLDLKALSPKYLRKVPSYFINNEITLPNSAGGAALSPDIIYSTNKASLSNGRYLAGILQNSTGGSTSIISAVTSILLDDGTYAFVAIE